MTASRALGGALFVLGVWAATETHAVTPACPKPALVAGQEAALKELLQLEGGYGVWRYTTGDITAGRDGIAVRYGLVRAGGATAEVRFDVGIEGSGMRASNPLCAAANGDVGCEDPGLKSVVAALATGLNDRLRERAGALIWHCEASPPAAPTSTAGPAARDGRRPVQAWLTLLDGERARLDPLALLAMAEQAFADYPDHPHIAGNLVSACLAAQLPERAVRLGLQRIAREGAQPVLVHDVAVALARVATARVGVGRRGGVSVRDVRTAERAFDGLMADLEASASDDQSGANRWALGLLRFHAGRFKEAGQAWRDLPGAFADLPLLRLYAAILKHWLGDSDAARAALRAIAERGGQPDAWFCLALVDRTVAPTRAAAHLGAYLEAIRGLPGTTGDGGAAIVAHRQQLERGDTPARDLCETADGLLWCSQTAPAVVQKRPDPADLERRMALLPRPPAWAGLLVVAAAGGLFMWLRRRRVR